MSQQLGPDSEHQKQQDSVTSVTESGFNLVGGFHDIRLEAEFRHSHRGEFSGRLIATGLLGGVLYCVALFHDLAVFGNKPAFNVLMADRLMVLASGLWLGFRAYQSVRLERSLPLYSMLSFELIVAAGFLIVVYLHGGSIFFHTMSMLAIVIIMYVFLPNLWIAQLLIPWSLTIAFLGLYWIVFRVNTVDLILPLSLLLLNNMLGTSFVMLINRDERGKYKNVLALQSLNTELRQEIASRKLVEERLRDSELNLQHLFDVAPVPLVLTRDRDGAILRINQAASNLLRIDTLHTAGMHTQDFYADLAAREQIMKRLRSVGRIEYADVRLRTFDGNIIDAMLTAVRTAYDGDAVYLVGLVDIGERKRMERELERLAGTDALTGLHNRRSFFKLAEHEIRRARRTKSPLTLLMLDIDDFKQINDRFGHAVGDSALKSIVNTILGGLREYDIPARIGGEEFAILLPGVAGQSGVEAAERLRNAVSDSCVMTPDGPISLTVSIGVVAVDSKIATIDQALRLADGALYSAKRSGRNRVVRALELDRE